MAFTRFHDDPNRIKKQLEESSFQGRYFLNTPGQGMDLPFNEDAQIRMQGWGANLHTNTVGIENDLHGLTRRYNRDLPKINNYKKYKAQTTTNNYKTAMPMTEESRASHPAWRYKDLEHSRWEKPFLNPQHDLEKKFSNNIQTRILEKDHFTPEIPVVGGQDNYYLTGPSICIAGNEKTCFGTQYH
jgi:hypothetical protein